MDTMLKTSIWQQFGAAIDMLDNAMSACPSQLWHAPLWNNPSEQSEYSQFWYILYHTLFWLDFYLSGSVEGFTPPAPFTLDELDPAGLLPERPYTKEELLAYLVHGRNKCQATIEALTDEKERQLCKFRWGEISFAELLLYNMRHVQEHAAQLNLMLGQNGVAAPGWVTKAKPIDIDSFWEYSDPAVSEERFRAALSSAQGDIHLELLTQIARTYSLRGRFDEAHAVLNDVKKQLPNTGARPHVRYFLERGRTYNSSGEKEKARALFIEAWEQAQAAHLEGLAVDAAHMVAITYAGAPEAIAWNGRGLAIARASQDAKARALIPAMLNNSAWDLHEMGRFDEALPLFEEAQAEWVARGKPEQILMARWSVARCLRSLRRYDEALTIQHTLEAEHVAIGSVDGYVFEELAENLAALGRMDEARPYFERAFEELNQDEWFVKNEAARLAGLKARGLARDII
jgi:tetratricopeptide (TPR) repeat protein